MHVIVVPVKLVAGPGGKTYLSADMPDGIGETVCTRMLLKDGTPLVLEDLVAAYEVVVRDPPVVVPELVIARAKSDAARAQSDVEKSALVDALNAKDVAALAELAENTPKRIQAARDAEDGAAAVAAAQADVQTRTSLRAAALADLAKRADVQILAVDPDPATLDLVLKNKSPIPAQPIPTKAVGAEAEPG